MWHDLLGLGRCGNSGRGRINKRLTRRCFLEPLEERKVLATLIVDAGTSGDDTIDISGDGANLVILRNGAAIPESPVSGFDTVQINAGGGADTINLLSLPVASGGNSTVAEAESNNSVAAAQDLETAGWTTTLDPDVDDGLGNPLVEPHVTVNATYDGTVDYYRFVLTAEAIVRVDIDGVAQDEFDSQVAIVDANDNVITDLDFIPAENDDGPNDAGSAVPLSGFTLDSFLINRLGANAPGEAYYIRVTRSGVTNFVSGTPYQLHVSAAGHSVAPSGGPIEVIINGGDGADTLNVAAGLMPLSALNDKVVEIGAVPFSGTVRNGTGDVTQYQTVENIGCGTPYTLLADLVTLGLQDGIADTTFVRPNAEGTKLLVDINGVPYFGGGINQILIIAVNGSSDADAVTVQDTVIGAHVDGRGGNDTITTAAGPDIVYGGDGDDVISTSEGNDYVAGGADNDTISGGDGDDSLHGNAGDDVLSGQHGHDVVSGGAGIDQVAGHQGQDVLIGGSGADQVLGNSDRDLLFAAGVIVQETGGPVSLGESDSSQFGDDNYFRLNDLREDWLDVVSLALAFEAFADKYDSGADDLVEDKLQGGNGDDVFFSDGTARIVDSAGDRETTT